MSGFYLYILFPWFKFLGFIFSWNILENQLIFICCVKLYDVQIKITHTTSWVNKPKRKKNCFGCLCRDYFFFTFSNTFDRWLYFVWSSFLVAIKDRSFDLFIQDDKKILFILEFRSITQPSFVFQFIGARKWKKSRSILLLSLVHLHLLQGDAGGRESVLQGEQWEVPLKNACKYYFFHMPLLFCCMILFLTVLWLHQYWLCHHHVICCLYATYIVPSNV